jgi:hypothetical protein
VSGASERHQTAGWLVLDEVLAKAGDAGTSDALLRGTGSSPAACAHAGLLRETGAYVTRNSRAQWVADPDDPRVQKWKRAVEDIGGGAREERVRYGL